MAKTKKDATPLQVVQTEQTPNFLTLKDKGKKEIIALAEQAAAEVLADDNASVSALDITVAIKKVGLWAKTFEDALKAKALSEREKSGSKEVSVLGCKVELAELGTKYDYSADPIWLRLATDVAAAEDKLKEREAIIKATKAPADDIDPVTGELFKRYVPVKKSTTGIKITL